LLRAERLYAFEYTNFAAETHAKIAQVKAHAEKADADYIKAIEDRAYARASLAILHDYEKKWG